MNNIPYFKFYLIIILFLNYNLFSQSEINNIHSINIDSKNGLPTNYINCAFKDNLGFYWIGTQSGLCKYDGSKIYLFKNNPKDKFSLTCSNIYAICQYQQYIIIGCESGVVFYDYYKNKFLRNKKINKELNNTAIFNTIIVNNKLFIASQKGFYEYRFKDSTLIKYKIYDKNKPDTIHFSFTSDCRFFLNKNHFLISDMYLGIRKIDTIHYALSDYIDYYNDEPREMVQYGNNIYIIYSTYGIVKADAITLEKISEVLFKDIIKSKLSSITSITQLKNKLYIGYKEGIIEYDPLKSDIKQLNLDEQNPNVQVKRLFNFDNNLVVVTISKGVYIIPYSTQKFFNPISENINNKFTNTYAITEYLTGRILIGGIEKLYLYNLLTNTIEKDYSNLFKDIHILQIQPIHKKNEFIIATYGKGLYQFNLETGNLKKIYSTGDFLSLCMINDSVWAGTFDKGLFKFNPINWKYTKVNLFENQIINFIKKEKNHVWIGTGGNGLYKIDFTGNVLQHLTAQNNKLSDDWVYHLTEDSNYIYIATENGLTLFRKKDSASIFFYDSDGLSSSEILSVYLDKNNNLWIQTLKGISKMIVSRLNNPSLKLFYNYTYMEGLVNYEFDQNAHAVLKNNYLVYGGTSGIDIFNPLKIKPSFVSQPIYITSFKISGKDYPADTNILFKKYFELDWKQNNFQIEMTAVSPLGTDKILYKYKLEGYDDEYSHPSSIRYISYTGLPGGTYTLNILATNYDGEWDTTPCYIYIKIIPPFWKTSWFIVSASILLFGSIIGFNQYRTYQIKKRNKELEEKVAERTRELANKNNEILSSIEYAKRIQQAILPTDKYIQSVLPNAFILYLPKDIVSGDFYWVYEVTDKHTQQPSVITACVDCTGHGVPGALMSMIGNNLLNQIVIEKNITSPEKILQEMNKGVQTALKQGQGDIQTNDGMDASIVHLLPDGTLLYAGAYRPIVIIKSIGELEKHEGDKFPIGGVQMDADRTYTLHTLKLNKGDCIYLFSDGYADQFGGEKGKKMMMKRFFQLLQDIHSKPLNEQKELLANYFIQWKTDREQVDDVLVIGIRIT